MSRAVNPNSVRQTAKRLGVQIWIYQKYLAGESVSMRCAKILADRLNIPLDSINVKKKGVRKIHQKRPQNSEYEFARRWNADPKNRTAILEDAKIKYEVLMGR